MNRFQFLSALMIVLVALIACNKNTQKQQTTDPATSDQVQPIEADGTEVSPVNARTNQTEHLEPDYKKTPEKPQTIVKKSEPSEIIQADRQVESVKYATLGLIFDETDVMRQIAADFYRRNITTIYEADISSLTDDQRSDYANLRDQVVAKQSQIEAAFRAAGAPATYSFDITLRIADNGRVLSAEVVPKGSIPEDFVAEVKRIVESWTFRVKAALAYKFPMRLRK